MFQLYSFGTISPSSDPDYTVTFTGYTDPHLSSSLSLVATVQSNKTEITCKNDVGSMEKQCTVQIIGKNIDSVLDCAMIILLLTYIVPIFFQFTQIFDYYSNLSELGNDTTQTHEKNTISLKLLNSSFSIINDTIIIIITTNG